jgi:hypothetical protein
MIKQSALFAKQEGRLTQGGLETGANRSTDNANKEVRHFGRKNIVQRESTEMLGANWRKILK